MMVGSRSLCLGFCAVLVGVLSGCNAQQAQTIFLTDKFLNLENANSTHRGMFCDIQNQIYRGEADMQTALQGMKLSVSMPNPVIPGFMNYETKYPFVLKKGDGGLMANIMDDLADRAGFTWRESFHVFDAVPDGFTYTDSLVSLVDQVDLVADYWIHLQERIQRGVAFPEGFWDTSLLIVGREAAKVDELDLSSWKNPFTDPVWGVVLASMIFSCGVFWVLERTEAEGDLGEAETPAQSLGVSLFLAAASFTGGGGFTPRTFSGRLFTISWTFTCLLLTAAYTANLASFLVVNSQPSFEVKSMEDAAQKKVRVCMFADTAEESLTRETFPNGNYNPVKTEQDMFEGVHSGQCKVTVTSVDSWAVWQGSNIVNANCTLKQIAGRFRITQAGVGVKSDSGVRCTSLVRDVLDLHMKAMKADGTLDRLKEEYFASISQVQCASGQDAATTEQLGLNSMGGTFLLHFILSLIALGAAGIEYFVRRRGRQEHGGDQGGSAQAAEASKAECDCACAGDGAFELRMSGKGDATLGALLEEVRALHESMAARDRKLDQLLAAFTPRPTQDLAGQGGVGMERVQSVAPPLQETPLSLTMGRGVVDGESK